MSAASEDTFFQIILGNPFNAAILDRLPELGLPDSWLVSGALFQTVWNHLTGRPPGHGIKDYDLFYFDGADLSWEAEDRVIKTADDLFADLDVEIELRNQARVHLWYEERFGRRYAPLSCSCDGVDNFLQKTSMIAVRPQAVGGLELYAPHGLQLIWDMTVIPNDGAPHFSRARYSEKLARWRTLWPELREA